MKFALGFLAGAIIIAGLFFYFRGGIDRFFSVDRCIKAGGTFNYVSNECQSATTTDPSRTPGAIDLIAGLNAATIEVPDGADLRVMLTDGAGEFASGADEGIITMGDVRAAITDSDTPYAVAAFSVSHGGTGTFTYIGLFGEVDGTLESLDFALLGDRIRIEGIEVTEGNQFTVQYLDRGENEPMAAPPTIKKRADFAGVRGKLLSYGPGDERITINYPKPGDTISSPLTVTGSARGMWYFEASFPVIVTDWDGKIIAEVPATAEGEWMTEDFVPFKAVIAFPPQEKGSRGTVIFKRDNASGLPEHDAAVEIPVVF